MRRSFVSIAASVIYTDIYTDASAGVVHHRGNSITLLRLITMTAGSKIKVTSMLHMAWELLVVMAAYRLFGIWAVRTTVEEFNTAR